MSSNEQHLRKLIMLFFSFIINKGQFEKIQLE